jgi:hypothetical protein
MESILEGHVSHPRPAGYSCVATGESTYIPNKVTFLHDFIVPLALSPSVKRSCSTFVAMHWSTSLQLLALLDSFAVHAQSVPYKTSKCRKIPGDDGWPSIREWNALNDTVSGRLIKTAPAGHVCHDPTYDAKACETLNSTWIYPWGQYVF